MHQSVQSRVPYRNEVAANNAVVMCDSNRVAAPGQGEDR